MKKHALFFLLFYLSPLMHVDAKVMDHIHPVVEKTGNHSMRNIDYIYLINLDQRPEKYQRSIEQLTPYGIYPLRFSAVNGWELTREEINDLGVKFAPGMDGGFLATKYPLDSSKEQILEKIATYGDTYFCGCLSQGAMGCTLSHLSILQDAYDSGYETIWIMEDDIEIVQNPHRLLDMIDILDKREGKDGWDILFTDRDIRNAQGKYIPCSGMARRPNYRPKDPSRLRIQKNVGGGLRRIGARFGSASMILRRSGIKKLLNYYETYQMYHPYDMDYHAPEGMRLFTVLSDIVTNISGAISDNGGPMYLYP